MKGLSSPLGAFVMALAMSVPASAGSPETSMQTEYLMTLHAPLDAPQAIDQSLLIYNVQPGGWVDGPRIKGKFVGPGADWLRVMPSGVFRLDVRATMMANSST
ncbi:hypothetical protein V1293_002352 [Bradyrhizobium sp. AZCC 1693]